MRTVYVMTEGQTEEVFVNEVLSPYMKNMGIVNTVPIGLETSTGFTGGDITFERYKINAEILLKSDQQGIVTSLIDYYKLRNDFPGINTCIQTGSKSETVLCIEQEIFNVIGSDRFVPYIQLHEFEGLLFADAKGFGAYFPSIEPHARYIINQNPNPEMINDGFETNPAARLKNLFQNIPMKYLKTFHGPMIALENGIDPILNKCPRFKTWVESIIEKALM